MLFTKELEGKGHRFIEVYRLIRKYQMLDINQIKKFTNLKHATCVRVIDEMLSQELIIENGVGASNGGRKPKLYKINPVKAYIIGVELSNLYTTVLLMNLDLKILSVKKLQMDKLYTSEDILQFIVNSVDGLIREEAIPISKVLGVGVGLLTDVDDRNGQTIDLMHWSSVAIQRNLKKALNLNVFVQSGTNLAALVEYRKNYWQTEENVLFVASDLSIRSSLIINGKLLYHSKDMTESFGHMSVETRGERCSCGMYGCLNTVCSLPSIRKEIIRKFKMGKKTNLKFEREQIETISYYKILKGIDECDPLCLEVLEYAVYYLGIALSNLALQLRPGIIILGGTLAARGIFIDQVIEVIEKRLENFTEYKFEVKGASASFHTVPQGAGCLVLDIETCENM